MNASALLTLLFAASLDAGAAHRVESAACVTDEVRSALKEVQLAAAIDDRAYRWTERLVLDVGARPAGTEAEARARAWALRELAAAGLDEVRAEPFEFARWTEESVTASVREPVQHALRAVALGGSPGTSAPLRATVIRFASMDALRAADPRRVAGRAVFLDAPMARTRDRTGYRSAVQARLDGPALAATKGAAAFVLRSVGTDRTRQPHAGMTRHAADQAPIAAVALSVADAELMARLLAGSQPVVIDLDVRTTMARGSSANVRAELRGAAASDRNPSVVLAAHLDSWHVGTGASDDASGVGTVMAAAALLQPYRSLLRRDVSVILFGAEEPGIAGGHAYIDAHRANLNHVVAVESDLGSGRLWRMLLPDPQHPTPAELAIAAALEPLGIALSLAMPSIGGPDVGLMAAHGVRVYDLDPDATDYFDIHHTDEDTLEHVSALNLRQHAAALATFALIAATVEDRCLH